MFTPYHDNGLFANVLQAQFWEKTKAWLKQDVVLCEACNPHEKHIGMIGISAMIEYDWLQVCDALLLTKAGQGGQGTWTCKEMR